MNAERGQRVLFFASLAYRLGLLNREQLVRVVNDSFEAGSPPVEDVVRDAGGVTAEKLRRFVETARELLAAHNGDVSSALADISPDSSTRAALATLAQPSIHAALAILDAGLTGKAAAKAVAASTTTAWDDVTMVDQEATIAESVLVPEVSPSAATGVPVVDPEATSVGEATLAHSAAPLPTGEAVQRPTPPTSTEPEATIASLATTSQPVDPDATIAAADPDETRAEMTALAATEVGTRTGSMTTTRKDAGTATPRSGPSRFRVVRSHARGGLGEVFVALDGELNREVALKEIQDRHADDAVSRARFVVEAEVTGGLEHPGIVPVYGLGEYQDGRPYYAMRFVRGESLKEAIARFHRKPDAEAASVDSHEMELHKLLRRFVDVCNAMEYAHVRGVLHRDLKPANVMLGPFGETLVVDWGLAKPFDDSSQSDTPAPPPHAPAPGYDHAQALGLSSDLGPGTGRIRPLSVSGEMYDVLFGTTVGTPHYMSPEQAEGRVELSPASDIYSLGATLYNLLTGTTPYNEKKLEPLLARVRKGDFPPPRQVNPEVPQALDAICRKAMALRTNDRYPSARALAEDVEHWMADEPVSAYAEPWPARAARWARKHRTLVTTAAALLVASVVGLGTTAYLVEQERARTEVNFQLARSAVDEMLTQLGAVDLVDVPGAEGVRRAMLEKARDFYLVFLKGQNGHRASVRQGAGQALERVGEISELLGAYRDAEASLKEAVAMLRPLASGNGAASLDHRRDLARARHDQGILATRLARYDEAEEALREAVELRQAIAAAPHATEDDRAAAKESLNRLGALLSRRPGRGEQARAYLQSAIRQSENDLKGREAGAQPTAPEARRDLARFRNNLANLLYWSDPARAAVLYGEARDDLKALRAEAPTVSSYGYALARSLSNLASLDVEQANASQIAAKDRSQHLSTALAEYTEAVKVLGTLAHDYPKVPEYRFELAEVRLNRARLYQDGPALTRPLADFVQKDLDAARELFQTLTRDYPGRPDYRLRAADTRIRLGLLARRRAVLDPNDAKAEDARAVDELRGAVADARATRTAFPDYAEALDYRLTLAQAIRWLGVVLRHQLDAAPESSRPELARALAALEPDLAEAAKLGASVLHDDPSKRDAAGAASDCLMLLHDLQFDAGRHVDALSTASTLAEMLRAEAEPSPIALVTTARLMVRDLDRAQTPELTARYAPQAIALLKEAIRLGFRDAAELDRKDYRILRGDPGFEALKKAATAPRPASG